MSRVCYARSRRRLLCRSSENVLNVLLTLSRELFNAIPKLLRYCTPVLLQSSSASFSFTNIYHRTMYATATEAITKQFTFTKSSLTAIFIKRRFFFVFMYLLCTRHGNSLIWMSKECFVDKEGWRDGAQNIRRVHFILSCSNK